MKKITFISIIITLSILITSCYNNSSYDIPVVKESTVPDSIMKFKFNRFIDDYITKNPEWNNNGLTKKDGDIKFKKHLIKNFNDVVKNNGFELKKVLISNNKPKHVVLYGQMYRVYITIVGTLDKSVDVTKLVEGKGYIITSGKFIRFIGFDDLSNLTGWNFTLETTEFGREPNNKFYDDGEYIYSYGTSYWKNIVLQ